MNRPNDHGAIHAVNRKGAVRVEVFVARLVDFLGGMEQRAGIRKLGKQAIDPAVPALVDPHRRFNVP